MYSNINMQLILIKYINMPTARNMYNMTTKFRVSLKQNAENIPVFN